jgi:hypothetical protein
MIALRNRRTAISLRRVLRSYKREVLLRWTLHGGRFEYLNHSPASRMRRRKGYPVAWGYNWATGFLGAVNTGTWSSRTQEVRVWDSKIWFLVSRETYPRMTVLARTSRNCKLQIRLLVWESVPYQQKRTFLAVIKMLSLTSDECLRPKQTGQLSICLTITLILSLAFVWGTRTVWEPREKGTSAVGIRYQRTGEDKADWENLVHTIVNFRLFSAMDFYCYF